HPDFRTVLLNRPDAIKVAVAVGGEHGNPGSGDRAASVQLRLGAGGADGHVADQGDVEQPALRHDPGLHADVEHTVIRHVLIDVESAGLCRHLGCLGCAHAAAVCSGDD